MNVAMLLFRNTPGSKHLVSTSPYTHTVQFDLFPMHITTRNFCFNGSVYL